VPYIHATILIHNMIMIVTVITIVMIIKTLKYDYNKLTVLFALQSAPLANNNLIVSTFPRLATFPPLAALRRGVQPLYDSNDYIMIIKIMIITSIISI